MAANPMTQFEVYRIGPEIKVGAFDISFTNASLFMVISSLAILIIFNLGSKKNSILPNKIQLLAKSWILFGSIEFFFEPRLNIIKIARELMTMNKLALVKEISKAPTFISGPIL